ncbi:serine protease [Saccharothrix violaceirubra]|uniref:Secreted trypsin-like serine protease n=1 Tax=Saccharothrix violaceirubra TaxID=413306 RepID=A0A7W7T0G7_9PSEU|nr:serine protease [Saccharothrix violaceirubra]MBB4964328.1 secreted trypsin-like serine protease [Saccharothrix violaceirubra]
MDTTSTRKNTEEGMIMAETLRRLRSWLGLVVAAVLLPVAGVSAAAADPGATIVGGTRASTAQYPWVVYLATTSGYQYCGGTLVAPNKVLTAAHCTEDDVASSVLVVAGRDDKNSSAGTAARVTRIWIHPSFSSVTRGYDVSVLTLDRNLTQATLPVATAADANLYTAGTSTTILGWGTTRAGGQPSRYLLRASVPVTGDQTCSAGYGSQYKPQHMVCAGLPQGGVDTCQGDSGGPLVAGGKLIGVTSFGEGCASARYPGVYARVSSYETEIRQQLAS